MKRALRRLLAVCTILSLCVLGTMHPRAYADGADASAKLSLAAEQFTDENIYKYHDVQIIRKAGVLCDEQDKLPETPDGDFRPLENDSSWQPVYGPDMPGAACYVDLGQYYTLTHIAVYDTFGSPTLTIETGEPFRWHTERQVRLDAFRAWKALVFDSPVTTRYVRLSCAESNSGVSEIGLYGRAANKGGNTEQPARTRPVVTADTAFGVNAFVDDPIQVSKVAGTIREFHNVSFTFKEGKNYFAPSANNAWNFDEYYRTLYERNIEILPCIQGTVPYISGESEDFSGNEKPLPPGADPQDPASYATHASILFNYAARYGSATVDPQRLTLGANQTPRSGLGYIRYYENFNEQNKDWEGAKSYFTPYQFAAMCSADYDGHEGTLGENYGIKNADPDAKLVMGGLVGRNVIEYVALMKFWFENNRTDRKFVPDVLNLHRYVTTACPEETDFEREITELRAWADENIPGVEIWVTEFGPEISDAYEDVKSEAFLEAKGNATVRQFLLGMGSGVDRMVMFMLRDTSFGVYADDGLVTEKGRWETKPSWHYVYGTRTALAGTVLDGIVRADEEMYIYRFRGLTDHRIVYALWTPTADDSVVSYVLDTGNKRTAHLTTLAHGYAEGVRSTLPINGGSVTVNVSARPVFVTLYDRAGVKLTPTKERLPIRSISGDPTLLGRIAVMFDEQDKTPFSPTLSPGGTVFCDYETDEDYVSKYPNLPELARYPMEAVLDLGAEYVLTEVAFYDSYSTGDVILYGLDPSGEWRRILGYPLNTFQYWKVLETETRMQTRFIKIEKYNLAVCYEAALYGYKA